GVFGSGAVIARTSMLATLPATQHIAYPPPQNPPPSALAGLEHHFDAAVLFVPERLVHLGSLPQAHIVGDDERWVYLPFDDALRQIVGPAIHVGLPHAPGQSLVHRGAEGNFVDQA